jgi:predicted AAA+ superfamily ATPase
VRNGGYHVLTETRRTQIFLTTEHTHKIMSNLKPWREIAHPRADVLGGTFQQSEFAADLSAVAAGNAPEEYCDAEKFFARTFITAGMAELLTAVSRRLHGRGGEPVVQLKTSFGGGKTHTLLAVWHLARRECALSQLKDVPALIDKAGLSDAPKANVAVLDGTALAPAQPRQHGGTTVKTLWGELAWQLGGAEAFARVAESDAAGTSPGKDVLREVLVAAAPCVVLLDELVAYTRQFANGAALAGGTFESNMSFVQALTEAVKQVPNAVLLASLPEGDREAGGERGAEALKTLEHIFGRVEAIWRTTTEQEAFEIVRRRLFEDVGDDAARDDVCDAFAALYRKEKAKLPLEVSSEDYRRRLAASYPIHPEVFDRLYQDWAELATFQRTRGVLKLAARAIFQLWKEGSADALIMPSSLPLGGAGVEDEFARHLSSGWSSVIAHDIKGEADTVDGRVPRFGEQLAARRVARTLFLGTAPSSVAMRHGAARGLSEARVLLGCLQPGQGVAAVFTDALAELANKCFYLYAEERRYWFDTFPTLRRVMEERRRQINEHDVMAKIEWLLGRFGRPSGFDGAHVFVSHADVPDDERLRLVFLPADAFYSAKEERASGDMIRSFLRQHGSTPRNFPNRLLFVATEVSAANRLREGVKTALAWKQLGEEAKGGRLTVTVSQQTQITNETAAAENALPRAAREAWRWLLCPAQHDPKATMPEIEAAKLDAAAGSFPDTVSRVCEENEWVISRWSPVHLRDQVLRKWYWQGEQSAVRALVVLADMSRYLYLPRLRDRSVFEHTVAAGAVSRDFFGLARGTRQDGDATKYDGFTFGCGAFIQVDNTLLLLAPETAAQIAADAAAAKAAAEQDALRKNGGAGGTNEGNNGLGGASLTAGGTGVAAPAGGTGVQPPPPPVEKNWRHFHGSAVLPSTAAAKIKFGEIYDEVIAHLAKNPNANVRVTLEIAADFSGVSGGAGKETKRTVETNTSALRFAHAEWEEGHP